MEPVNFVAALRRRWRVIMAVGVVGLLLGLVAPLPTTVIPSNRDRRFDLGTGGGYGATATFGIPPGTGGITAAVESMVFYGESQKVMEGTARAVHLVGALSQLKSALTLTPQLKLGSVKVVGQARTPKDAVALVNAYTASLTSYLASLNVSANNQTLSAAKARVDSLQQQITALGNRIDQLTRSGGFSAIAASTDPTIVQLRAQRDAVVAAYQAAYQNYANIVAGAPQAPSIVVLQPASLDSVTTVGAGLSGFVTNRALVGLVLFVLALLGGAALALVLEHFDRRVRSRVAVERSFGDIPVLAEIPARRLSQDLREVSVVAHPGSAVAESYRMLRTLLLLEASRRPTYDGHRVIVVTCAHRERRTSAVSANLAASFAETGKSVLVVRMSPVVDTGHERAGLVDFEMAPQASAVPGVRTLDLSQARIGMTPAVREPAQAIALARQIADVVVVEAGPVLTAHDVAAISPASNDVLVVAEYRVTTVEAATRCVEYLRLMKAPVCGVVLVGGIPSASDRSVARAPRHRGDQASLAPTST